MISLFEPVISSQPSSPTCGSSRWDDDRLSTCSIVGLNRKHSANNWTMFLPVVSTGHRPNLYDCCAVIRSPRVWKFARLGELVKLVEAFTASASFAEITARS